MRLVLIPLVLTILMAGCTDALPPLAVADAASVVVFGRGLADIGISAITGRDCSIVRLDRQQTYCAPLEPPYGPAPFCTRTLADVTCWSDPERFAVLPRPVADGPALTAAQESNRLARWPKSLGLY